MSEEYEKEFCVLLKSFREKRLERRRWGMKWNQGAVAKRIGVSRVTYNQWENGIAYPTRYHLRKIVSSFYLDEQEEAALYRAASQVPPQIHNLPFDQNPLFTGREAHLEQLSQLLKENDSVAITQPVSISGLGGIGKTQLALEYAHRCYQKELYRTVLWVNAADELLQASYAKLAEKLDLPEKKEQELAKCVQAVKDWLEEHTHWLLIMDNADNVQLAHSFFPLVDKAKPHHGRILLTTRSQIIGRIASKINIDKMEPAEGLLFLLRRSKKLEEDAASDTVYADVSEPARQLVELLDGHPLALDQAGAYIEDDLFVSFSDYINLYRAKRSKVLRERGSLDDENDGKYGEHPASVVATFELCFEMARKRQPLTDDILRFCAFLHPDAIPVELFQHDDGFKLDADAFDNGIRTLRRYSLLNINSDEKTCSIHRLVQAVLSEDMPSDIRKQWRDRVARALGAAFPDAQDFKNWRLCERLVSHTLECATWTKEELTPTVKIAALFQEAGIYLSTRRTQSSVAETLQSRVLSIYKEHFGIEHQFTAVALINLANTYTDQGKYEQAEQYYQLTIPIWEQGLNTQLELAMSLSNLAILYTTQGKYEQAEPLLVRVLSIREQQLEAGHPDIASAQINLANVYFSQYKIDQAAHLYQQAIPIREKLFGAEHPMLALDLWRLAAILHSFARFEELGGRYDQAEARYEQAGALYQRSIGILEQLEATPPFIQTIQELYADLLHDQGFYAEAAALEANDGPSV